MNHFETYAINGGKKIGKEESPELKSRAAAALKLFQRQEGEAMLFIDFFAGIGGFRLGMEMAGHHCEGYDAL